MSTLRQKQAHATQRKRRTMTCTSRSGPRGTPRKAATMMLSEHRHANGAEIMLKRKGDVLGGDAGRVRHATTSLTRLSTPRHSAVILLHWQAVIPRKAKALPCRKVDLFYLSAVKIFSSRRQFYAGIQRACEIQLMVLQKKQ